MFIGALFVELSFEATDGILHPSVLYRESVPQVKGSIDTSQKWSQVWTVHHGWAGG